LPQLHLIQTNLLCRLGHCRAVHIDGDIDQSPCLSETGGSGREKEVLTRGQTGLCEERVDVLGDLESPDVLSALYMRARADSSHALTTSIPILSTNPTSTPASAGKTSIAFAPSLLTASRIWSTNLLMGVKSRIWVVPVPLGAGILLGANNAPLARPFTSHSPVSTQSSPLTQCWPHYPTCCSHKTTPSSRSKP
jgi:hypothetical protein